MDSDMARRALTQTHVNRRGEPILKAAMDAVRDMQNRFDQ